MNKKDPQPKYVLRVIESVSCMKFACSKEKTVLITGTQVGNIKVWDLKTNRIAKQVNVSNVSVLYADIIDTNTEELLISHDRSGCIKLLSLEKLELRKSIIANNVSFCPLSLKYLEGESKCLCAYPLKDAEVAVANLDENLNTTKYLCVPETKVGMVMRTVLYAIESTPFLLCAYEGGSIALWDVYEEAMLSQVDVFQDPVMAMDTDGVWVFSASVGKNIFQHRISQDNILESCKSIESRCEGHNSIAIRGDGKIIAVASWDNRTRVYSVKKMTSLAVLSIHPCSVACVAFNALDNTLATAGAKDGRVALWDVFK